MARPKELNFFSFHWDRGIDSYQQRFSGMEASIRGEASPSYTRAPLIENVPERIASLIPDVRLVYLIRHPVDRIRSEYLHRLHHGKERAATLAEAISTNPRYLIVSKYGYQIDRYLGYFAPSQLLVITTERLMSERQQAIQEVLAFLGADGSLLPPNLDQELNRGDEKQRIPRALDPLRTIWRSARPITGRIPSKWRHRLRSQLGGRIDPDAMKLSQEQEDRIWTELKPDFTRLREIVGPEMDLWATNQANHTP